MRALVFDGSLHLESQYPRPRRMDGEALLSVKMAGICATDLEIIAGYKGFHGILGHELVGEVVETDDRSLIGKRVCAEINLVCGACDLCLAGFGTHCRFRTVIGILNRPGAFADYIAVPVRNLHLIPESLTNEEAVFVEPLAAAFEIVEQVKVRSADRVAVIGDGKLAFLCAQVLAATGANVTVVGKHDHKLDHFRDLGLQTLTGDAVERGAYDFVVDATGSPQGLVLSLHAVRPRGTLVLKSTYAAPADIDMSAVVVNEVTIVGSRCGPFPRAIKALAQRAVEVRPLIQARLPLSKEAVDRAAEPGSGKILIDMTL